MGRNWWLYALGVAVAATGGMILDAVEPRIFCGTLLLVFGYYLITLSREVPRG